MDSQRFSTIAHERHRLCNPLHSTTVDAGLERIAIEPRAKVCDAGCGKGEMLLRLVRRADAIGVGIDRNAAFLAEAAAEAHARAGLGTLEWCEEDAAPWAARQAPGSFAAALCIGSTHAFGTLDDTLAAFARLVRPGGWVLAGEGYWRREPDAGYLEALGATAADFTGHAGNFARGAAHGLEPLWSAVATLEDWDAYEGLYADSIERFAAKHPEDPDHDAMLSRIRGWRATYARWGRDTLGFGLYLFRR
jgi:SAM-dependent methyltransferase